MSGPSTLLRAARPAFRQEFFTQQFARQSMKSRFMSKRFQSTAAPAAEGAAQQSVFKRMWDSPIGLKTVHFWAPVMKWGLVIAGIADFARPAENLSLTQNAALTATGAIWTRWCLIIKPKNILLATVNFFLGCVGVIQVSRIINYNLNHKGETAKEQIDEVKEGVVDVAKEIKGDVKSAIKS